MSEVGGLRSNFLENGYPTPGTTPTPTNSPWMEDIRLPAVGNRIRLDHAIFIS